MSFRESTKQLHTFQLRWNKDGPIVNQPVNNNSRVDKNEATDPILGIGDV